MQLSHRHSSLELTGKFKNVILDVRKSRDDEAEVGLPVPSGKRLGPPQLAMKALVARDDVALARMQAIAYDQVAGNSYITDRCPIECEDKNREKVRLKEGAEVDVTVEADKDKTTPKKKSA